MKQLQLEDRHLNIIIVILKKYPYKFYAFGSRARNDAKKNSDLDLGFFDNIPFDVFVKIKNDFEESDFPFLVDLVNFSKSDPVFIKLIEPDLIELKY